MVIEKRRWRLVCYLYHWSSKRRLTGRRDGRRDSMGFIRVCGIVRFGRDNGQRRDAWVLFRVEVCFVGLHKDFVVYALFEL